MSTLAISGSSDLRHGSRTGSILRFADLGVLAAALPVFLVAGLPMAGYAVAAGAWLVARAAGVAAERRAARMLAAGDRRGALGTVAVATLGRVWLVALAVLLVGLLAGREDGLAGAVLALALVTTYLAGMFLARLVDPPEAPG